jgi:hypothetical protein
VPMKTDAADSSNGGASSDHRIMYDIYIYIYIYIYRRVTIQYALSEIEATLLSRFMSTTSNREIAVKYSVCLYYIYIIYVYYIYRCQVLGLS